MPVTGKRVELVEETADPDETQRTWPFTLELKVPIEFGSDRIERITFRRGRMGDIKGMKLSSEISADQLLLLASRLSGQPTGVIDRLDQDDAGEVMEIAMSFFAKCLSTGKKPSPS